MSSYLPAPGGPMRTIRMDLGTSTAGVKPALDSRAWIREVSFPTSFLSSSTSLMMTNDVDIVNGLNGPVSIWRRKEKEREGKRREREEKNNNKFCCAL